MDYIKAGELPFDPRPQMGAIFADGFYELGLKFICKDKAKLVKAMAHIFDLDCFYVAVQDEEIAALATCIDGKKQAVHFDKKSFRKTMGFLHGSFAYLILNRFIMHHQYPFVFEPEMGAIEFVAAAPAHRGKGVAGKLIEHMMANTPYAHYILEVADTNAPAIRLYTRLGFAEFMRTPAPKRSGFNHFIYMRISPKQCLKIH